MTGPLAGVRVLDLTRVLAGPVASMMLGDMGADVIKVEDPDGGDLYRVSGYLRQGGESVNFLTANRNKRSICVDLTTERGRDIVLRIADTCDVLVENYRPGTAERLGIGPDAIAARNPALIYCSISGFGPSGPYRDLPAVDPIIQAMSGAMALTGEADGPPVRLGSAVGDLYGAHMAVQGILLALLARHGSGMGQRVEMSLLDAAVFGLMPREGEYFATGEVFPRMGHAHPQFVPFQAFEAKDGWIYLAVFHDALFEKLCRQIERPDLVMDGRFTTGPGRVEHRETLVAELAAVFARESVANWVEQLGGAGVPCAPINEMDAVFADPQVVHNGMVVTVEHPTAGPVRTLANPVRLSATPASVRLPPPLLGQHTREILGELGLSTDDVSELLRDGVVA
jgi:crotonobetainyl-CoA:carnitine CoA-transferase CaiB-like acyl-CoA transferase